MMEFILAKNKIKTNYTYLSAVNEDIYISGSHSHHNSVEYCE